MWNFLDKYKAVFWVLGGGATIYFALKIRKEMKHQELPGMRIVPRKEKHKTYPSRWNRDGGLGSQRDSGFDKREKPQFGPGRKIFYPSTYPFLVLTPTNRIESGWEFREDARDHVRELPKGSKVRIVAQRTAKSLGIDPSNASLWTRGETDLAGRRKRR